MKIKELSAIYTDDRTKTGRLYYGNNLTHKVSRLRPKNLEAVLSILAAGWPEAGKPDIVHAQDGMYTVQYVGDNGRGFRAIVAP
jgi:hypothetical protein